MKRLVSVVLAVYNEEAHLAECLESLKAQTYRPLEIVAVDDGSVDKTPGVLSEIRDTRYEIRVFRQEHLGLGAARNRGAKEAGGEILVFADGDLVYEKNYIARLAAPILAGRTVGTCHRDELVKNPGNFWSRCWQINDHLPPERKIPLSAPGRSIFFRAVKKDEFLKAGGFEEIGYLDDRTLYQKLKKKALVVPGAVCWHYNPASAKEVFREARWQGKSLAKQNFWQTLFQYCPPNSLRRIIIDTFGSKEPFYFLFKIVFDLGVNWGIARSLGGGGLAK